MKITFARSATRHRIPRSQSARIARTAGTWIAIPAPVGVRPTVDRLVCVGVDECGRQIEVIAVPTEDDGIIIIHAMPARPKTLTLFEED